MYHGKEQFIREWPAGSPHAYFISYVLFLLLLRKYLPTTEVVVLLWLSYQGPLTAELGEGHDFFIRATDTVGKNGQTHWRITVSQMKGPKEG